MDLELNFGENGLIPTIIQHYKTNEVLMLAYSNIESINLTMETKIVHFFSRSRQEIWKKGATSGNYLHMVYAYADCDRDSLLIFVDPDGPACHTGNPTCFFSSIFGDEEFQDSNPAILQKLYDIVGNRKINPVEGSYTNYLFNSGIDKILKKVGEESAETIIASKNDSKQELVNEASDLFYHLIVLFNEKGIELGDIYKCLKGRHVEKPDKES